MGSGKGAVEYPQAWDRLPDAVSALEDDLAVTIPDDLSDEERFVTVGMDALDRILVVVYAWRGERVRIISARKATPQERRTYEEKP